MERSTAMITCVFFSMMISNFVESNQFHVDLTATVGEKIQLICTTTLSKSPNQIGSGTEISWTGKNGFPIFGTCQAEMWEDYAHEDEIYSTSEECILGIVNVAFRQSGEFTYECHYLNNLNGLSDATAIKVHVSGSSETKLTCVARPLPLLLQPSTGETLDIICKLEYKGLNESALNDSIRFQRNNKTILPDISSLDEVIVRQNFTEESEISQLNCIFLTHEKVCEYDNITNYPRVGIIPLINQVTEGGVATFECIREGTGNDYLYEWTMSRHNDLHRISGTATPIFRIDNVTMTDDGMSVQCLLTGNGVTLTLKANLRVIKALAPSPADNSPSTQITSTDFQTFHSELPEETNKTFEDIGPSVTNILTPSFLTILGASLVGIVVVIGILLCCLTKVTHDQTKSKVFWRGSRIYITSLPSGTTKKFRPTSQPAAGPGTNSPSENQLGIYVTTVSRSSSDGSATNCSPHLDPYAFSQEEESDQAQEDLKPLELPHSLISSQCAKNIFQPFSSLDDKPGIISVKDNGQNMNSNHYLSMNSHYTDMQSMNHYENDNIYSNDSLLKDDQLSCSNTHCSNNNDDDNIYSNGLHVFGV